MHKKCVILRNASQQLVKPFGLSGCPWRVHLTPELFSFNHFSFLFIHLNSQKKESFEKVFPSFFNEVLVAQAKKSFFFAFNSHNDDDTKQKRGTLN